MATQNTTQPQDSYWADEELGKFLRLRIKTLYNADYFERIVLPLMNIPQNGQALDVGCGYGGLSIILARLRPDLQISGVDPEAQSVESAAQFAKESGLTNVKFEQGDGHQLKYEDNRFEAVMCQTVLSHVRDAEAVVREMARVLKPGEIFMAAEYTDNGTVDMYDNVHTPKHDDEWRREYFRISQIFRRGKKALGYGDEEVGNRVPVLATNAGLDVFDMRLNDRALHLIPPYQHDKQRDYAEFLQQGIALDTSGALLKFTTEMVQAGGGSKAEARWLYYAIDEPGQLKALEEGRLTMMNSHCLYLTFARKRGK